MTADLKTSTLSRKMRAFVTLAVLSALLLARPLEGRAEVRPIDTELSTVTVLVSKAGPLSAFADDHTVRAPIASGSISEETPLAITLTFRAASLTVLDPGLASDKRAGVQSRMLGPDVLDVDRFPDVSFASRSIEPSGIDRWTVAGQLTLHGQSRTVSFPVTKQRGAYHGNVVFKQRDFGITPISIAGGAVQVKDELRIEFEIVPR